MKTERPDFTKAFLAQVRHSLGRHHLPRIARCLNLLSEKQIWSRAHPASNSVGNLVLHLSGNVRQWIVSGLGGAPDWRERDKEFNERGPIPRQTLNGLLRQTVIQACRVLDRLTVTQLAKVHLIQGFSVTGLEAVFHVAEHFAYHSGQIIYITKAKLGRDLGFTRLPGVRSKRSKGRNLPAI